MRESTTEVTERENLSFFKRIFIRFSLYVLCSLSGKNVFGSGIAGTDIECQENK